MIPKECKRLAELDLPPSPSCRGMASRRAVGPPYTSRLVEYVESRWRPNKVAAQRAERLRQASACIELLDEETCEPGGAPDA